MDIQKEREAFEVALNIDEYIGRSEVAFSVENGCYELTAPEDVAGNISISKLYKLNSMFKAWQAAKAQAVPGWIETAIQPPGEGQRVIISGIYGVGIAEFSYLYKDEFVMYGMGASNPILSKDQVKFWHPLPNAPQEPK